MSHQGPPIKVGRKVFEGLVKCESCGQQTSSTKEQCEHCGATRKVNYKVEEISEGRELTGAEATRATAGAQSCPYCGSLNYTYDAEKRQMVCGHCNGGLKDSGTAPEPATQAPVYQPVYQPSPTPASPNRLPLIIGGAVAGLLGLILIVWFMVGVFTTHDVKGTVVSVSWIRNAEVQENQIMTGQGWNLPPSATQVAVESKYTGNDSHDIVGYSTQVAMVESTPEIDHYTYSDIPVVTPGALIGYTGEYRCSAATPEPGGGVSYDYCKDPIYSDDTYGTEKSDPTPVYKDPVMVPVGSGPTPVYGPATPIFASWYTYQYWQWVKILDLPQTSGHTNEAYWPTTEVGANQRVVNGTQYYRIEIKFSNGKTKVYEGSDPSLLSTYQLESTVTGYFNSFGGLNSTTP